MDEKSKGEGAGKMDTSNTHAVQAGEEVVGLPPEIQDDIGRRLRGLYGQLAAEPLPDRFVKLLGELAVTEKSKNNEPE